MNRDARGATLPRAVDAVLREFVNALGKTTMYPPGHRFIEESTASLIGRLDAAMTHRDTLAIGFLPHGLLVDGVAAEPLPGVLREFAVRMHRKNIAVVEIRRGLETAEAGTLLAALAASDADDTVGRDGLQLPHARVEPMSYDALGLTDSASQHDLDEGFWLSLAEAAFDRRAPDGDEAPSIAQLAAAITDRSAQGAEGAQRVYEALSSFATALTGRGGHAVSGARERFVELLSALSQSTTARVVQAAPSAASRRRFLTETLELVPPTLMVQVLESVADADGETISAQLHTLLGKLARSDGGDGGFPIQVLGLIQRWDDETDHYDEAADPHVGVDPARLLGIGVEVAEPSALVLDAARHLINGDRLVEALNLLDDSRNDPRTVQSISGAILDAPLIERLLAAPVLDAVMIERVATRMGGAAVGPVLDALAAATERATRRRLLDILVRIGPGAEATFLARLYGAPWYLARNILAVLAQFSAIADLEPVLRALGDPDVRVRQEALKVLVRHPAARERAIAQALGSDEEALVRMALTSLGSECPPSLVGAVLAVLDRPGTDLQVPAIHVVSASSSPLVAPRLLAMVRARRGFFRRVRLQPKSPAMLAALEVLARRWSGHPEVAAVLQLAAASTDPELRAAAAAVP